MKIQIDQGYLEYDQVGSGIPLLFIHGYPLSRKIWEPQLAGLSDIARIIVVDLRGHGSSFPFDDPYPMDLLASDCQKVLTQLNITEPAIICGLSMGGYVTLALYRQNPELFKALILTSTRAGADSPEGKLARESSIRDAMENGVSFNVENMLPKAVSKLTLQTKTALVDRIHRIMVGTSLKGMVGALQGMKDRPDSTSLLPHIACPTLIIHGEDDQLIPMKEAEQMNQLIPYSRLVKIPGAGHLPCLEQPELFNQAVRDFITRLDQVR